MSEKDPREDRDAALARLGCLQTLWDYEDNGRPRPEMSELLQLLRSARNDRAPRTTLAPPPENAVVAWLEDAAARGVVPPLLAPETAAHGPTSLQLHISADSESTASSAVNLVVVEARAVSPADVLAQDAAVRAVLERFGPPRALG